MKIAKISQFTGIESIMDINITDDQYAYWLYIQPKRPRPKIQDIFPNLTNGEREFLMTGSTPEEFDKLFKPKD